MALLAACSGGGGGGGGGTATKAEVEPNDTTVTATPLSQGVVGFGDVSTPGDIDMCAVQASANTAVKIELFGTRMDQNAWDVNANVPNIIVYDPDGTTMRVEHDYSGFLPGGSWSWGMHDLDMPLIGVGVSGTYIIAISQDDPSLPGGTYGVKVTTVPVSGVQVEAEAEGVSGDNDTAATAEPITPGTMVGFHVDGEHDYYKFHIASPSTVRFELTAYRNGAWNGDDDDFDTYAYLYDTDGTTELFSQDDSFFYDSAIQYQIDTPGDYYFDVTECCGSADTRYLLSYTRTAVSSAAESEPNDDTTTADTIAYGGSIKGTIDAGEDDYFKFSGTKGDMLRLQVIDSGNGQAMADSVSIDLLATDGLTSLSTGGDDAFQTYTTILQETGTFYVHVTPNGGLTDYRLELSRFKSATYETEPNNSIAESGTLTTSAAGVIDSIGDVDVYQFTAAKDHFVTIAVYASDSPTGSDGFEEYSGYGSDLDPLLTITDGTGTPLASSTCLPLNSYTESITDGLPTAAVSFVAPASGRYYVNVESASGTGDASNYYVITKR
jgi:hypothetical protein